MEGAHKREALVGSGPFMPRKALVAALAVLRFARTATDEGGAPDSATRRRVGSREGGPTQGSAPARALLMLSSYVQLARNRSRLPGCHGISRDKTHGRRVVTQVTARYVPPMDSGSAVGVNPVSR